MKSLLIFVVATLCLLSVTATASPPQHRVTYSAGLVNTDIKRTIDIRTHVAEHKLEVTVKNTGAQTIDHYLLAVPENKVSLLSYVEGYSGKSRMSTEPVTVNNLPAAAVEGTAYFQLNLLKPLKSGESASFVILAAFTRTLDPLPTHIEQADNQLVVYTDSAYILSPYTTLTQKTIFKLGTGRIESYTKKGLNAVKRSEEIEYGPYEDIEAFASHEIRVHYQNNAPFVTASSLKKNIEVSHWGNIATLENYELIHNGAKLTGPFSRADYQRYPGQAPASYRSIVAHLPRSATNIYFRDVIGNISTSHVRRQRDMTHMEVEPRYPMFGGWTADFYISYDVPAKPFLSVDQNDPSRYVLNITIGSPFPSMAIDELLVNLILPEGASQIEWQSPFDIDSADSGSHFSFLDVYGRPTIIIRKSNVVKHHNQHFIVTYTFPKQYILQEPFLLISTFFLFFLLCIVYFRIELSISDGESVSVVSGPRSKRAGRAGALANIIIELVNGKTGLIVNYESKQVDAAEVVLAEVRSNLAELSKTDAEFGLAVRSMEAALGNLKAAGTKYAKASQAELAAVRSELVQALEEMKQAIKQLAAK